MSKTIYLCWIDDVPSGISSLKSHINLLETDHNVQFEIDEHYNTAHFDSIARNIEDDLIFLIDYNLKTNEGNGMDGNEVIELIRKHNKKCPIVFYSSKSTQTELRKLVNDSENIVCAIREDLQRILKEIADGTFTV